MHLRVLLHLLLVVRRLNRAPKTLARLHLLLHRMLLLMHLLLHRLLLLVLLRRRLLLLLLIPAWSGANHGRGVTHRLPAGVRSGLAEVIR